MLAVVISLSMYSCSDSESESTQETKNVNKISARMSAAESEKFMQENIALFDANVRSLDEENYVRELYFANFAKESWDKVSVGFEGFLYNDDGRGNDLVANDEIYTSDLTFKHDATVPYDPANKVRSVFNNTLTDVDFKWDKELGVKVANEKKGILPGHGTIRCKFNTCSTGCFADWVWDGFGCICPSNCDFEFGW